MEGTFPLKSQDQATRLGHFGGVIFDGLACFQSLPHFLRRNFALKHTLNGVDTENGFGIVHVGICVRGMIAGSSTMGKVCITFAPPEYILDHTSY